MSWDYSETYVAACLRIFRTHAEGIDHERDCPDCRREIDGESFAEDYDEGVRFSLEEGEDDDGGATGGFLLREESDGPLRRDARIPQQE